MSLVIFYFSPSVEPQIWRVPLDRSTYLSFHDNLMSYNIITKFGSIIIISINRYHWNCFSDNHYVKTRAITNMMVHRCSLFPWTRIWSTTYFCSQLPTRWALPIYRKNETHLTPLSIKIMYVQRTYILY